MRIAEAAGHRGLAKWVLSAALRAADPSTPGATSLEEQEFLDRMLGLYRSAPADLLHALEVVIGYSRTGAMTPRERRWAYGLEVHGTRQESEAERAVERQEEIGAKPPADPPHKKQR